MADKDAEQNNNNNINNNTGVDFTFKIVVYDAKGEAKASADITGYVVKAALRAMELNKQPSVSASTNTKPSKQSTTLRYTCGCKQPAKYNVCRTNANGNLGRVYYTCNTKRCQYFEWTNQRLKVDDPEEEQDKGDDDNEKDNARYNEY